MPRVKASSDYIDYWCARNVRKVSACICCLHYAECANAGHSLAPRAIEHHKHNAKEFDYLENKEIEQEEDEEDE